MWNLDKICKKSDDVYSIIKDKDTATKWSAVILLKNRVTIHKTITLSDLKETVRKIRITDKLTPIKPLHPWVIKHLTEEMKKRFDEPIAKIRLKALNGGSI